MGEICYIGAGSNIGDRRQHLRRAHQLLDALPKTRLIATSALYETEPVGSFPQPWFLNEVVSLQTQLTPEELLEHCLWIEKQEGRVRSIRWGPRTLDLDILLFGNRIIQDQQLQIPHPRMASRRFVLLPLSKIAPATLHPVFKKNILTLLDELPEKQGVSVTSPSLHHKTLLLRETQ